MIKPVLTEKSLEEAENGKYTFWVDKSMTKYQIKQNINKIFGVTTAKVRVINKQGETKRTFRGRIKEIKPRKKAVVTLSGKDKIDLFETKKK